MSRRASGREDSGHVESTRSSTCKDDDDEEESTGYGPTLGHPKFQAVHYYHNVSCSSSQASCRTPTATTVMWLPSIRDKNDEDDDASDAAHEGNGGLVPPSPQKKKKNHQRIPQPHNAVTTDAIVEVSAASGSQGGDNAMTSVNLTCLLYMD